MFHNAHQHASSMLATCRQHAGGLQAPELRVDDCISAQGHMGGSL
jgi:hypothetical protein